jgi:hypothetical protein
VIAEQLGVQPSSLAFRLAQFVHADLVTQRCLSRQLIYSVSVSGVSTTAWVMTGPPDFATAGGAGRVPSVRFRPLERADMIQGRLLLTAPFLSAVFVSWMFNRAARPWHIDILH